MPVKVSVVVPVYNPGRHVDDCIASILRQSLPTGEFEAIFVDDGSTDGTGARLDALAGEHRNVSVIHIPNSGWPGRPRNVGIEAAAGEYVYFVDNDDWIGDEALERLYGMARRNHSDVVIGKVVGHGRKIPNDIFRVSRDRATLSDAPLLALLTPHKLFRKAFLDQHGIRFPEGRRRLEDHPFVLRAYFLADVISVLADYPCYHWVKRGDASNASLSRFDPRGYYQNVREALDVVEQHTEPGPFRDRLLRHWYRGKVLQRLGGAVLASYPEDYRRELFEETRRLAQERFGPGVAAGLATRQRVRSRLLLAGRLDSLVALAAAEGSLAAHVSCPDVTWDDGALELRVEGHLSYGDGQPVTFRHAGGRTYWNLPVDVGVELAPADLDTTAELRRSRLDISVRSRQDRSQFLLPGTSQQRNSEGEVFEVRLQATARLDIRSAAAGGVLPAGVWDVLAGVAVGHWDASARLAAPSAAELVPGVVGDPPRIVIPYATTERNLSVDLDQTAKSLLTVAPPTRQHSRVHRNHDAISLTLPLPGVHGAANGSLPAELRLHRERPRRELSAPAALVTDAGREPAVSLVASLAVGRQPTGDQPGRGSWRLGAVVGERRAWLHLVLHLGRDGTPKLRRASTVSGLLPASAAPILARLVRRVPLVATVGRALRRVRRHAGD